MNFSEFSHGKFEMVFIVAWLSRTGILNRILFQLFVKDLLPVPPTTVDRHVGDGEVMDDLDGLQVIHTPGH